MKYILTQVNGMDNTLSLHSIVKELGSNPSYPSYDLADWLQKEGTEMIISLNEIDQSEKMSKFIDEQRAIMSIVMQDVLDSKDWDYFNETFMHTVFYVKEVIESPNKRIRND